jgi:hypothetical protein
MALHWSEKETACASHGVRAAHLASAYFIPFEPDVSYSTPSARFEILLPPLGSWKHRLFRNPDHVPSDRYVHPLPSGARHARPRRAYLGTITHES